MPFRVSYIVMKEAILESENMYYPWVICICWKYLMRMYILCIRMYSANFYPFLITI